MIYYIYFFIFILFGNEFLFVKFKVFWLVVWFNEEEVEKVNVGIGVKKVWVEIYGFWGSFEELEVGVILVKK